MLIYRDSVRTLSAAEWRAELDAQLNAARGDSRTVLHALVFAGELESALEDAASADAVAARELTSLLAQAWLDGQKCSEATLLFASAIAFDRSLELRRPEGYAYYALDPAAYVRLVEGMLRRHGGRVRLLGVRSIGTSLSAVVRASVRRWGVSAERITVRPGGHPWDRRQAFSPEQRQFLLPIASGDEYWIVDEGPGLSGSTFLAVAEALMDLGVPATSVVMIGSHAVDTERLLAPGAVERWSRFRYLAIESPTAPTGAVDLSHGGWRKLVAHSSAPCWLANERFKYLIDEGSEGLRLVKFVGLASYGDRALEQAHVLAEANFTPALGAAPPGYLGQSWQPGELAARVRRQSLLDRLADYIAFRARAFPARETNTAALEQMARVNVQESLSRDLPRAFSLELAHPVYADARMQPHEWLFADNHPPWKVDATDHGDDHLFPGPCDIAWDLAGAIVEWQLDSAEQAYLLERYRRQTADDARSRLRSYLIAYVASRLGWGAMAELSAASAELGVLQRIGRYYRQFLCGLLE